MQPNEKAFIIYSLAGPGERYVNFWNLTVDLKSPLHYFTATADFLGHLEIKVPVPTNISVGQRIWIQAVSFDDNHTAIKSPVIETRILQ
jgi:hypothetical protein